MDLKRIIPAKSVLVFGAALTCAASCVYVDDNLGRNFIPKDQIYEVKVASLPLDRETVWTEPSDSLSCYSSSRITVGAIRDGLGITGRASAFTVVPVLDTIDLGENPKLREFHFNFTRDTTSYKSDGQKNIIQNIKVYALKQRLDSTFMFSSFFNETEHVRLADGTITDGIPVYGGGDSLSFNASPEYAREYIDLFKKNPTIHADQTAFLNKIPGIYVKTDDPVSEGGRINMFDVAIGVENYYVTGNYAELKITSKYGKRENVDTSFLFYFGPADRTDSKTTQSAFNICRQETDALKDGAVLPGFKVEEDNPGSAKSRKRIYHDDGKDIVIEGGSGLKPVISAKGLQALIFDRLSQDGVSPDNVIINKATIVFPFKFPDNHEDMKLYPPVLSPTSKISLKSEGDNGETLKYATYAGLTDASVESENQGDVNRSLSVYSPDISHHVQEVIRLKEDADFERYDIWMLIMAYETVTTSSSNDDEMNEYYQNLAYANYYNNLYGYGYGGYGYGYGGYGYDSYGYGYNNYLNYQMLASMYSNSGSSKESTELMLDKDRYYDCVLGGTEAEDESLRPYIKLVYSILQDK